MRTLLLISWLLLVLLAACGGQAPVDPPRSPAPSVSPTPSAPTSSAAHAPVPPVMPALARKHTVAGAKAFVRYVVAQLNYAQTTLDSSGLAPLFSEGCTGCRGALNYLRKVQQANGSVHGGVVSAHSLDVTPVAAGTLRLMEVEFTYASTAEAVDLGHGRIDRYPAGSARDRWILSPRSATWVMTSWGAAK